MDKMKTNQDGGSVTAKDSSAAGKQLEKNQAKEGAAKYKGAHDYDTSKGSHDHPHGAAKMGYSQSFGAARVNGYTKGAAKVASIMSFGASKYMKHGAADTGHGGPEGHTHPTKTIKSRTTSGGGSSSSSLNTTGSESSSATLATDNLKKYQAGLVDLGPDFKPTKEETARANARVAELKKKDATAASANAANAISSSSSSNTTNAGGRSETSEETFTSPESMAETLLQGNIQDENRQQTRQFNIDLANITAAKDSIAKRNLVLNKLPQYHQDKPSAQTYVDRQGGRAAYHSRIKSGLFSPAQAREIYQAGQNKDN